MISKRLRASLDSSICIRDIFEEGKKLAAVYGPENIYNFSIGNPSVEPPAIVNEAMKEILDTEPALALHGYPANVGHPEVRQHIADYLNEKYGCTYTCDGIVMTSGAASALAMLSNTILDKEDEVITFAPYFWEYKSYVETFYGKLVPALCNMETLQPDPETFRAAFSERTRFVLINTPNNPTGAVYTPESLKMVASILEEKEKEYGHPIYLVSDEPYRKLAYGIEVPYLTDYYKNTIVVYSYSKALSIPGERIGYIAMEPEVEDFEDLIAGLTASMRYLGYVNAPSLQQKMLMKCVDASVDISIYEETRDILYQGLTEMGYTCIHPDGAFYLFVKALEEDDAHFCEMAKKEKILMAPGTAFYGPGWVRISYCVPAKVAKESLPGFQKLMEMYQK
ncbi:Aspartate aminotransferase [uncultured Roseburia sp.]|uniref:Aminotransferase n=1 Tax=Brotonthovivens ammoniilytica TaxID=2981725 RepID=A0ABT2TKR4_9FIRM|nr:pyridoxal phosphate-dependent aminotransferase [Brotonthovivens ammoniilytica]MCU6762804.1 pyridoxal phosphate-dependent aminotransferase [Brotonthovivens ammoniilytica]SCI89496.1 Aspartate aminotransferase [uncultured Roseburia sp.]